LSAERVRSPAKIARRLKLLPQVARAIKNWPTFMLHYALGCVPARAYELRVGARIRIGRGVDHVPIIEVFLRRDYGVPPADAVVVDLGANIGVFAIFAAVTARARVFAYEPAPKIYALLQENVRLNGCGASITCRNEAAAGAVGDRELVVDGPGIFFPTLVPPVPGAGGRATVRCTTLEEILASHRLAAVDLLKIDIEGSEYELLYGARDCLTRIREIRMEYHNVDAAERNVEHLTRYLAGQGYRITRLQSNSPTHGNLWAVRRSGE
jgi:FkbM family methyltransferase